MSNELIKREMPHQEMLDMAKIFSESGMFPDMKSMGMAFVKIQAGKEIGISPFAAMSGIHIIQGKATIGAGLMAGCVKGSLKYDYKVKVMNDIECSIDFLTKDGKLLGNSTFTKADATKAGTKNMDKHPKNMLFSRAMSNGTKWYCPDVFTMPVYTPEEMGDPTFTEDITHENVPPVIKLSAKEIKAAESKLNACKNLSQLQVAYTAFSPELKVATLALKDKLKGTLPVVDTLIATPGEGATIIEDGNAGQ